MHRDSDELIRHLRAHRQGCPEDNLLFPPDPHNKAATSSRACCAPGPGRPRCTRALNTQASLPSLRGWERGHAGQVWEQLCPSTPCVQSRWPLQGTSCWAPAGPPSSPRTLSWAAGPLCAASVCQTGCDVAGPRAGPGGPGPGGVLSPSSDDSFLPTASQEEEGLTSGENWFMMRIWSWGCTLFDAESQACELPVTEVHPPPVPRRSLPHAFPAQEWGAQGVRPGGVGSTCELIVSHQTENQSSLERLALLTGWAALGSRRNLEGSHRGGGMSRALLGCQEGKQSCPNHRPYSGSYALPSSCHDTRPSHLTHSHVSWRQEIPLEPGTSASA